METNETCWCSHSKLEHLTYFDECCYECGPSDYICCKTCLEIAEDDWDHAFGQDNLKMIERKYRDEGLD